ncbi:MAG TPA: VOC family protein [Vicinamibacterales bacterium]|nr:VOC family protein [Vicinamibacterales bacterium]
MMRVPRTLTVLVCAAGLLLAGRGSARLAARASAGPGVVERVDSAALVVEDMDRSVRFFTDVLTFEKTSDVELDGTEHERLQGVFGLRLRIVRLRLGNEFIELLDFIAPEGRPIPVDARSNDLWFQHVAIIVSDMDTAYARLRAHNVRHASAGPQRLPDWNPNAGGIEAFYFRDPDGHTLEILEFPAGKGDPKWHRGDRLFLGIDHTAVVVEDTERSLRFYRDGLGLEVAGESENYGIEQERLNNVFGARLRITALRAASGFGIEFLEYLAPSGGRSAPAGTQPNDQIAWQTRLVSRAVQSTLDRLPAGAFGFVSPGIVTLTDRRVGFRKGVHLQDPDGHAIVIVERQDAGAS